MEAWLPAYQSAIVEVTTCAGSNGLEFMSNMNGLSPLEQSQALGMQDGSGRKGTQVCGHKSR